MTAPQFNSTRELPMMYVCMYIRGNWFVLLPIPFLRVVSSREIYAHPTFMMHIHIYYYILLVNITNTNVIFRPSWGFTHATIVKVILITFVLSINYHFSGVVYGLEIWIRGRDSLLQRERCDGIFNVLFNIQYPHRINSSDGNKQWSL